MVTAGARVVVAMSGGVDSSVAAAILVEQGYEVIGVTLNLWPRLQSQAERDDACCSLAAVEDARSVADKLGIPHYTLNFRDVFERTVIQNFVDEYARGRTPNPCLRCNEHVKFDSLLLKALGLGAEFIATGHYARIDRNATGGRYRLRRGLDSDKDQSYALYTLKQDQLSHTLLPLGGLRKAETRRLAAAFDLPVAEKPDSQEICFVPENDYGGFLREYAGLRPAPGEIVTEDGIVLGRHRGIPYYTVGQRRGLGLAAAQPYYVLALDVQRNRVVVGAERDLYASALVAEEVNLISEPGLDGPRPVTAKVRYRAPEVQATVMPLSDGNIQVTFAKPQRAPAPGQAVVLYQGDDVFGGGTIRAVERSSLTRE